ncbi:PREDICTED: anthranilate synthase alpha subunit 2, chloroplastic isoform X1 [Brassica oleracea var. oleracea]|uniref:anthranilate synthase alpha subunit 2, chloroplastic isoform X1 n=1 Tax=Brassica oleracea var. oleracea TaxID=109376 RepID=UPI0006A73E5B|nr:PREDICTED: anthranilate synthase alpha subunit 2, chloroplastic isoform X1 [Brassica oleracea var. oleracea]
MSAVSISSVKSNLSAVKAIAVTHHRPPPSFRCPSSLASLSTTTSLHCNDVSSISRSKLLPPSRLHPIKSSPSPTPSLAADSSVNQLTKFKEAAEKGNLVPLYRCVFSDHLTPILAYRCLVKEDDRDAPSFLFESVEPGLQASNIGRYSVVGAQPTIEIVAKGNVVTVMDHGAVRRTVEEVDDPMMVPQKIMEEWEPQRIDELPEAFCGGWVGYFSYDTVRFVEKKKLPFSNAPEDDRSLPDVHLGLYDDVIVFDHIEKKAYVIHWVRIDKDRSVEDNYTDGMYQLESLVSRIQDQKPPKMPTGFIKLRTEQFGPKLEKSTMTSEAYKEAVLEAKEHILAGDIFQIVLSQRFERRTFADPFEIYRALRIVNPSPYMAYLQVYIHIHLWSLFPSIFLKIDITNLWILTLQARGCILVASSPEILLRSKNRKITNRPLAGTVRRGKTPKEDLMLEKELLSDEKQCAEHIMLVDLGRNDVGKVSKPGSVEVEKLMNIERYSHVMHISSTVKGELLDDLTSWDALRAALPVGTVSGAPKVKAMELIDKLEVTRRGPYSGGFGGISFNGDMDIALALRTMVFPTNTRYDTLYSYKHSQRRREWIAHIQAGAGVVADSNPEAEQRECENKAAALARAIDLAESSFLETPVVTRPRINNVLE